jgi:hypothetical protein
MLRISVFTFCLLLLPRTSAAQSAPLILQCTGTQRSTVEYKIQWDVELYLGTGTARRAGLVYTLTETPVKYILEGPERPPQFSPEKWQIPKEHIQISRIDGSYISFEMQGNTATLRTLHWSKPEDPGCVRVSTRF